MVVTQWIVLKMLLIVARIRAYIPHNCACASSLVFRLHCSLLIYLQVFIVRFCGNVFTQSVMRTLIAVMILF